MADVGITIPSTSDLLAQSAASEEFKSAVLEFEKSGTPGDRIVFGAANPPVKVLRVICALVEQFPDLVVDRVEVNGHSGCSDYVGSVGVNGGEAEFEFTWDCAWKARQEGWTDFFDEPDQIRAAKTFGYRCMKKLERLK